jgi:rhamnosyltransferase
VDFRIHNAPLLRPREFTKVWFNDMPITSAESSPHNVAAIIVAYKPNLETLERLISVLMSDEISTILVDNGGGRAALSQLPPNNRLRLLDMGGNQGIGSAINAGIAEARKDSATHVITFDQDSLPSPGMVRTLASEFDRQVNLGVKIGAVGPLFIDRRQTPPLVHPFTRLGVFGSGHHYCVSDSDLITVDTLITSGCLTSLNVLTEVGVLNEGYFVDCTDIEWCFRAKGKGFLLLGVCGAQMTHELGHGVSRSIFGLNLFEYSPIRRYYYARNTTSVAGLPYVSIRWKVRLMGGLLLRCLTIPWAPRAEGKALWKEGRMLLRGTWDGLRGISGALESKKSSR